jgi:hypothetical protein
MARKEDAGPTVTWLTGNAGGHWTVISLTLRDQGKIQCVRKVAVHLWKVMEVMSTSVYTSLNPFNFIRKHFL